MAGSFCHGLAAENLRLIDLLYGVPTIPIVPSREAVNSFHFVNQLAVN